MRHYKLLVRCLLFMRIINFPDCIFVKILLCIFVSWQLKFLWSSPLWREDETKPLWRLGNKRIRRKKLNQCIEE